MDFILSRPEKMKNKLMAASSMGRLKPPEPSPRPKSVMIHAVTVVPMLAPMMTATAPASDSRPALTNPTTITVVADELWMAAVTAVPVSIPLMGLPVICFSTARILLPAIFCRPSLMSFMAKRNTANAPAMLMMMKMMSAVVIYIVYI